MIGSDDDNGILQVAGGGQGVENLAHLIVGAAHHAAIQGGEMTEVEARGKLAGEGQMLLII